MKKRDIIYGLLMLATGVFAFIYSGQYNNVIGLGSGSTGGGLFPRIASGGLILTSLVVLINALRGKSDEEEKEPIKWIEFLITLGMLAAFYLLLRPLGFILTSALATAALMFRLGCRKWWVIALYSVIMPTVIFCIFYYGMYVSLPLGILRDIIPKY